MVTITKYRTIEVRGREDLHIFTANIRDDGAVTTVGHSPDPAVAGMIAKVMFEEGRRFEADCIAKRL